MLTPDEKTIIKATVPLLREGGIALTTHFYKRMFEHNPELKNIFNMGNQSGGKQQTALAMAVLAYAENIDDPTVLLPVVNKIAQKHTSLNIRAEHYPIVGKHLVASIREVLGEAATPAVIEAWTNAYNQLAAIFIDYEAGLYVEQSTKPGGWSGWRPFIVRKKIKESEEVTSFYLYPADGGPVAPFLPGQYISVNVFLPQISLFQARQYSLSNASNNSWYRISVKKEKSNGDNPNGMISNYLHDHVKEGDMLELASPAGDFVLDCTTTNPVVFISGGIGQTPLLSMLETLLMAGSDREVTWVHGCRNCNVHAFDDLLEKYRYEYGKLRKFVFYEAKEENTAVEEGIVEIAKLPQDVLSPEASFYICGPSAFIKKQHGDLKAAGIASEAIFYEEFGPHVLGLN